MGCFLELLLSSLFMSLLMNFFLFFFKFLFLTFICELQISRGSHREVFLTLMVPVRQGHFVRNFVNQRPAALLEISSFISISMGTAT